MHEVVDAGEQEPPTAAEPAAEWVLEGTRIGLVALHPRPDPGNDAAALLDLRDQAGAVELRGAGDTRDDRRRVRRPAPEAARDAARTSPARADAT